MTRIGIALVAVCLVTAGCAGFAGAPDSTGTVTPAPVPTDDPGPTTVAPGVTTAGVTDPETLVRAHVARLSNVSYTVVRQRRVEHVDGEVLFEQRARTETEAGYDAYRAVRTIRGSAVPDRTVRTRWQDGRAVRWTTHNGTTDRRIVADSRGIGGPPVPPREALSFDPTYNRRIRALVTGVNVTGVTPIGEKIAGLRGSPLYRLSAADVSDPTRLAIVRADRVGPVSFTATVAPSGLVRSYTVQYTVVRNGTRLRIAESVRYSDVGTTVVDN